MGNPIIRKPVMLLMTATIAPSSNMFGAAVLDPSLRFQEYKQALEFYLTISDEIIDRILFIENSGYDLSQMQNMDSITSSNKKVEFVSFVSDVDPTLGKGSSELDLMDRGLIATNLIDDDNDVLWKVTGRLIVKNIEDLITTAPEKYELYADFRYVPFIKESLGGNKWVECRVFSTTFAGYKHFFMGQRHKLRTRVLEKHLYNEFYPQLRHKSIFPRFKIQPDIKGTSGRTQADYDKGLYKFKSNLRSFCRRYLPFIWV